jgi:phosphoserine phosphatase
VTKFLVVFDVDSTLIQDEVIELLAEAAGQGELVKQITDRAMAGEIDFAGSLRERVGTLKGLPESVLTQVYDRIRLTTGVQELIQAIHAAGGKVGAVSGGFSQLLKPLAQRLELDFYLANDLEITDGKLTGQVSGSIVDGQAKKDSLLGWATEIQVAIERTVAVGDGANDLLMMSVAGLSVAFNAKPIVRQKAQLVIEKPDLRNLVEVLGL